MWFESWESMSRTVIGGVVAYSALIMSLRISGKRTLAKLNAFDLVVTVALGSTVATVILSKDTPLSEGLIAIVLLILLQYVVSWSSVRSRRFRRLIKNEPALLLYEGVFLNDALRGARLTRDEIEASARSEGIEDLAAIRAVVLETDGTLSVVRGDNGKPADSTLSSVPDSGVI